VTWCTRSGQPVATHTLAVALNAAQQPAEAERVARQALLRNRPTAALHYTHAVSLLSLERLDEAELALRECVRLDPRRAEAHDRLAQLIWMRTGNIAEATAGLPKRARGKFPHDDALRGTKAALLQGAGDARGAFACLAERAARPESQPGLVIRAGLAALEFEPATPWHSRNAPCERSPTTTRPQTPVRGISRCRRRSQSADRVATLLQAMPTINTSLPCRRPHCGC